MDPVSVLGLTCNILQLVESSYKGLALCWRLYKNGEDTSTSSLKQMQEELNEGLKQLQKMLAGASLPATSDVQALLDLCTRCNNLSLDLSVELDSIILPARRNVLLVVGKALKSATKTEKIKRLSAELAEMRAILDFRILTLNYALLRQSNVDLHDIKQTANQKLKDLLDAIISGRQELASIMSDSALASRKLVETEYRATESHIDEAQTTVVAAIGMDGSLTRTKIDLLTSKVASLSVDGKQHNSLESIMENLAYPEMRRRPESISGPHRDTCNWIFECESFAEWLVNDDELFWIQGKAGSGKSTLMNFLARDEDDRVHRSMLHWSNNESVRILSFYFWESGTELQRRTEGLLRSLVHQLLRAIRPNVELVNRSFSIRELADLGSPSTPITAPRLKKLFLSIIDKSNLHFLIILDGLDEFDEDEGLLDFVDDLRTLRRVKLCASSRSTPAFEEYFNDVRQLRMHELTAPAIKTYVEDKLVQDKRMAKLVGKDRHSGQALISQITWMAEGVFLWVVIVVRDLLRGLTNKDDLVLLQKRVERLPVELSRLFEAMWNRTKADHQIYEEESALYFSIAMNEFRGGSQSLLRFGLATNDRLRQRCLDAIDDLSAEWLGFDMDETAVATRIQVCTAGLLCVLDAGESEAEEDKDQAINYTAKLISRTSSKSVTFIHKTAREYVNSSPNMRQLLISQADDEQYNRRVVESEIVSWGLRMMTQSEQVCKNLGFPDLEDVVAALPWVEMIEAFVARIPQQQNFEGVGFNIGLPLFDSELRADTCEDDMCPSKTGWCFGRHEVVDFVAYIIAQGLVNVARHIIEIRNYPQSSFLGLLWLYETREWAGKTLLPYLLDHGANLNEFGKVTGVPIKNPSVTIGTLIMEDIIDAASWEEYPLDSYITTAQWISEWYEGKQQRLLPVIRYHSGAPGSVIFEWPIEDFVRMRISHNDMGKGISLWQADLSDGMKEIIKRLQDSQPVKSRRLYVYYNDTAIWPVSEQRSSVFFENFFPDAIDWDGYEFSLGCASLPIYNDSFEEPDISRFFEEVMSEDPFKTMRDAYKYMGWTDQDLDKYYEPLLQYDFRRGLNPDRIILNLGTDEVNSQGTDSDTSEGECFTDKENVD